MTQETLAWHFVGRTLRDGRPVPADGVELRHDGPVVMCASGLHASVRAIDALRYAPGAIACRVVMRDVVATDTDKLVARSRTILWRVDATDVLREFARDCALDVLHIWATPETSGIDTVVEYLLTGDESLQDTARAVARVSAWSAWAARASAWDARDVWDAWYALDVWATAAQVAAQVAAQAARGAQVAAQAARGARDAAAAVARIARVSALVEGHAGDAWDVARAARDAQNARLERTLDGVRGGVLGPHVDRGTPGQLRTGDVFRSARNIRAYLRAR